MGSLEQQKRNLKWRHSLGTVTLQGAFDAKPVQIQCSTIQASVLLLLNRADSVAISEAIEQLKVSPDELKRQLKPLCSKKFGVLQKEPQKGYNVSHRLSMNRKWNPPRTRVQIPLVVQKTTEKDRTQNTKIVTEDRKHAIDAAVVRIMKARKRLPHSQLIQEVTSQLSHHFYPKPRKIKERIEDLIEREYLERDTEK